MQHGGYPVTPVVSPELALGTALVKGLGLHVVAHLFFAARSTESCVTSAALPPGLQLLPRSPLPNLPVFLVGLTPGDLKNVGATHCTYSHYAVIDLDVTIFPSDLTTLLSSVLSGHSIGLSVCHP